MGMYFSTTGVSAMILILALILFTLYMMRRRSRQGLRTPKF
jgi:flagellar biogenesis protein FliO